MTPRFAVLKTTLSHLYQVIFRSVPCNVPGNQRAYHTLEVSKHSGQEPSQPRAREQSAHTAESSSHRAYPGPFMQSNSQGCGIKGFITRESPPLYGGFRFVVVSQKWTPFPLILPLLAIFSVNSPAFREALVGLTRFTL